MTLLLLQCIIFSFDNEEHEGIDAAILRAAVKSIKTVKYIKTVKSFKTGKVSYTKLFNQAIVWNNIDLGKHAITEYLQHPVHHAAVRANELRGPQ